MVLGQCAAGVRSVSGLTLPIVLLPDSCLTVAIRFSPEKAVQYSATVMMESNVPGDLLTVLLVGEGEGAGSVGLYPSSQGNFQVLSVEPNPSKGLVVVRVALTQSVHLELEVVDMAGKRIFFQDAGVWDQG